MCDVTTAHGEASLRRMLMRVPVALSLIDGDGRVEILNDRFVGLFGYTLEDVRGIEDWWQLAYPDPVYRQEAMANWQAAVGRTTQDGGDIAAVESRITCKNGSVKLIEASAVVLADGLVATFTDVTEQRRTQQTQNQLNRELRAIGSCNQALLRAEDERTLLDEICRIVRTEAGYPVACVAFAEHDADKTVRMVARAGLDDDYFTDARLTWADRDLGRGPIGTAIRTGEMVVVQDIVTDPRMAFWQERARQRGFRSAVALPLNDDRHETFGGLLIYSDRRNAITSDEIRLLEGLAADLAFGITMLRIRGRRREAMEKLAASEQLFRTLVENSPDPIARYDLDLNRVYLNPTIRKLFRSPSAQVLGTTPATESPLTEPERYMACIRQVIDTAQELSGDFAYRLGDGRAGWSSMRFAPEFGPDGKVASVLVLSHDISERQQAEEERKAHLHFLEALDRVNRAILGTADLEQMMMAVLDLVLDIFDCDRAFLHYPCDPEATEWWIPMERCKPAYPSVLAAGQHQPMEPHISATLRALLETTVPVVVGAGTDRPIPQYITDWLGVRSLMAMALRPMADRPWQFGVHQCSHARIWTAQEQRLFAEIGYRLSDALNSLVMGRNLRQSEARFRLVFENSPLPTWEEDLSLVKKTLDDIRATHGADTGRFLMEHPEIVRRCAEQVRIVDVNQAAVQLHQAGSKEALLDGLTKTFVDESYIAFQHGLINLANGSMHMQFDSALRTLEGQRREVTIYLSVCPGYEHDLAKVLVSLTDITERKRSEDGLRLATSVFATSQEGILISDAENRIIDVNPAFTRLTGYRREEVLGRNPSFLSAGRQSKEFYAEMWHTIEAKGEWQGELWNRRKNGDIYAEMLSIIAVKNKRGRLQHFVGAFSDISLLKAHEADLDRIAHYDMLTAVPNRRLLGDRLEQAIARSRRLGKSLAVCYLDLDGFKPINDQFGHEGGDRLLVEIARRLQQMSRADDTVARLGGDEFVLLWNDIETEVDCFQALERILAEVSSPMLLDGIPVSVSASIGVTLYPDDDVDADSLLRHADHAMYSAKQLGKNRFQLFDSRLEQQISSRIGFLAKVDRALEAGQFQLHYQPKVDCVTSTVVGAEALLRWQDPVLGLLGPKEFLPLIEADNLALRMGRWVMAQAIRQARQWHENGIQLPISINVFPRHLKYPTFVDDLRDAIAQHWPQMPNDRLLIEIVESVDLEELEPVEKVISECLDLGIGFSLDDFGTGYSSLIYLRRLSVQELKIDQSFVRDMLEDPSDEAIVVAVIGLGRAFGLRVVAEGVESDRHARHLVDLGCSVVQGFGLGRPMPASALEAWLADFSRRRA